MGKKVTYLPPVFIDISIWDTPLLPMYQPIINKPINRSINQTFHNLEHTATHTMVIRRHTFFIRTAKLPPKLDFIDISKEIRLDFPENLHLFQYAVHLYKNLSVRYSKDIFNISRIRCLDVLYNIHPYKKVWTAYRGIWQRPTKTFGEMSRDVSGPSGGTYMGDWFMEPIHLDL